MTPENFVYWLNGHLELSDTKELTPEQVQIIKDHIKLVLTKLTPPVWIGGSLGGTITVPSYPSYGDLPLITC